MRALSDCLNPFLGTLWKKARELESINTILQACLPEDLRSHCSAGSFHKGCLTIITDDAAFATPLRYAIPALRDRLRRESGLYQLGNIQVRVANHFHADPIQSTSQIVLGEVARETLREGASTCEYAPLRDAMLRLARSRP